MRNPFALFASTPVNNVLAANTFSGQQVGSLWETRAQARDFYPAASLIASAVWETMGAFTQQAGAPYTTFPTAILARVTGLARHLSPRSTGPIKKTTKFKKKLGDS